MPLEADLDATCDGIRNQIVLRVWEDFLPKHKNYSDFGLDFRDVKAALLNEGFPSLGEGVIAAIRERAVAPAPGGGTSDLGAEVQLGSRVNPEANASAVVSNSVPNHPEPTVSLRETQLALNAGDRKRAVRLRCHLDQCAIKELWSEAFSERSGTYKTKQTAFNRWQVTRKDTPAWADELMKARLLQH